MKIDGWGLMSKMIDMLEIIRTGDLPRAEPKKLERSPVSFLQRASLIGLELRDVRLLE